MTENPVAPVAGRMRILTSVKKKPTAMGRRGVRPLPALMKRAFAYLHSRGAFFYFGGFNLLFSREIRPQFSYNIRKHFGITEFRIKNFAHVVEIRFLTPLFCDKRVSNSK